MLRSSEVTALRYVPLRSAGTRNFFLSMSGIDDFGTFSTITYKNTRG